MAKKKTQIPKYGTITLKGIQYYRTRITDADGKELSLYAATCEELYEKQLETMLEFPESGAARFRRGPAESRDAGAGLAVCCLRL